MCDEQSVSNTAPSGTTQASDFSVEQFTKDGFKTLMEAIKHSNALPSGGNWSFHNVSDSFNRIMTDEGNTVLQIMNKLMRCNDIESNIRNRVLDEKMELVIEANDAILEKVANNIDEMNGLRKTVFAPLEIQTVSAEIPVNGSWNRLEAATIVVNSDTPLSDQKRCIKLITAKNIIRPQKFFKDKIDNDNSRPWCPRITDKPNSLKPLALFLEEFEDRQEFSHPYDYELDRFVPIPEQLEPEKPIPPKPLIETPLEEIDKPEQLQELVETLRHCKVFAVDVEHHSYRSFMGITCLLQISTHDKDYLIDTLALRDKLHILNEVFTKNNIVKIFHGADKDVEWLQRDLAIYVVNMFDTHQAAKALQYNSLSLAFLMKKFCNVLPNKQFQLADWRIRPLPEELKSYAREDTHYLIYIYHMLKQELLMKKNGADNLLRAVIERSTDICKKRYFKPMLLDDSHLDIYRRCKKPFNNRQLYALREFYAWRDNLAREEDESLGYILPNHMLLQIAETLPREMQGILACCNPIPPLVRSHLLELHQIVLKARDQPLEKAIMKDTTGRGVLKKMSKVNVDSALHCPHDLSKTNEFRDDLPTLLDDVQLQATCRNIADVKLSIEKKSSYGIFDDDVKFKNAFDERETFKKLRGFAYFSPYERYKLVKPFVAAEQEEAAKAATEEKEEEEVQQVERTDEDRISSIRDHFVQLSQRFSEELQVQKEKEEQELERIAREKSLLQMGGSRKRKREGPSFELPVEDNQFVNTAPNSSSQPNQGQNKRNRGRKRKASEVNNEEGEITAKKKKNRLRQQKRNLARAQKQQNAQLQNAIQEQNQQPQNQISQNQNRRQQHQKQNQRQQRQNQNQYQQHQNRNEQQQHQNQNQYQQHQNQNQRQQRQNQNQYQQHQNQNQQQQVRQQKKKQTRVNKNVKQQKTNKEIGFQQPVNLRNVQNSKKQAKNKRRNTNQNANFEPYDYASVDFRQFQGGAGSANKATDFRANFKPKNRNKKFNRGAKSSTFSNPHASRGGAQGWSH